MSNKSNNVSSEFINWLMNSQCSHRPQWITCCHGNSSQSTFDPWFTHTYYSAALITVATHSHNTRSGDRPSCKPCEHLGIQFELNGDTIRGQEPKAYASKRAVFRTESPTQSTMNNSPALWPTLCSIWKPVETQESSMYRQLYRRGLPIHGGGRRRGKEEGREEWGKGERGGRRERGKD